MKFIVHVLTHLKAVSLYSNRKQGGWKQGGTDLAGVGGTGWGKRQTTVIEQ